MDLLRGAGSLLLKNTSNIIEKESELSEGMMIMRQLAFTEKADTRQRGLRCNDSNRNDKQADQTDNNHD